MPNADDVDIMQDVRRCLDRQLVCDALNQAIRWPAGARPSSVRIHRFTPRPGGNFDFEYNVSLSDTSTHSVKLFARCPALPGAADAPREGAELTPQGVRNVLVDIAELNVTMHSMDCDPLFSQFARCADGTVMADRITKLYAEKDGVEKNAVARLACKPVSFRRGRRFVMRYREPRTTPSARAWAGKCYADDRGKKQCKKHRRVAEHLASLSSQSVRAAQLVGYDPELRMVITEWGSREVSADTLAPSAMIARRMAEVLAAVQSVPADDLRPVRPEQYWNTALNWFRCIETLCPELCHQADTLIKQLDDARQFPSLSQPVVVHGDFYASQILIEHPPVASDGPAPTTLLDLDTLATGDRCLDLGNALAHQWLWCKDHEQDIAHFNSLARELVETYETLTTPVDEGAFVYYWAATLFRVGAIHAFRDRTSPYVQSLWAMVEPVLQYGRDLIAANRSVPTKDRPAGRTRGVSP